MATYAEAALAEREKREAEQAAAKKAARDALVASAREAARPLLTQKLSDGSEKLFLDPSKLTVDAVDEDDGMVVLSVADGSEKIVGAKPSFGVYPDRPERRLVTWVDGAWQRGPVVKTMADVGDVLAEAAG